MALKKTPVVFGNARFTLYAPGCVRMEYAPGGNFSPYPSVLVGKKLAAAKQAEVVIKGKSLTIKTDRMTLNYTDDGENFSSANLHIEHRNQDGGKMIWSPGKQDRGNLGTVVRSLDFWKWCGGPQRFPVEGILSTEGGHFLQDEPRVYWNTKQNWIQNLSRQVWFDGYFFAYGNDYKGALKDFVTVFGPIPMVPRWTFGFWYSRWHAYQDKEFIDLAKRYRKEKVPIDVMIIDTDWRDGWGGYDWSKKYFPKPEKTLGTLKDMGLRVSLNDHPGYDNYEPLPDSDSHIPEIAKKVGPLPHNGEWACDWSNKQALEHWKDKLYGPFFDQGMDFWWIDGWIKSPAHSLDSQLWANHHYFELAEKKTGKRGMVLSRWGGIGSHRYPVQFSGDTPTEWHMLKHQIEFTAFSGNLGAVYWSHDIGGFFAREIEEEIYIRWFQFGSMSPVFRTHSDHGIREPWKFSKQLQQLFRKQTHIRYALAPYYYNLAREAHETGMPLIRPLYLEFNDNDGGALYRKHQYTIGRDLLVIPADGPVDGRTKLYRKRAYFPNGTWISLETNDVKHGMFDGEIDIPLELIPTYVRQGAILPTAPVGHTIGTETPATMHFDYFADALAPSQDSLYEDDGESHDHGKGRFARTALKGSRSSDQITFEIGAPKGSYKGMPKSRTYVVRVRLEANEKVRGAAVQIGKAAATKVKVKHTNQCLAGTVKSAWTFAEVEVTTANQPVKITMDVVGTAAK
jgi:alpha-glucosidase (family GH31 glycosyl hydrolase)